MCVCMCVCMCVYTCARTYVLVRVYKYVCLCASMHMCSPSHYI